MKLAALLAASILALAFTGCDEKAPQHASVLQPYINITPAHDPVLVGEATPLIAHTIDISNSGPIQWKVTPDTASIVPSETGQTATFSANQPGKYLLNATVQAHDGTWITSSRECTITVIIPVANEK